MGKRSSNGHFSSDFFKDSKASSQTGRVIGSVKKQTLDAKAYLYPIDESEEFYDPFSDLNLFLSKRIKKEMIRSKKPGCWSAHIQKMLMERILPEFRQKFPKYHLGSAALKKSWDKVRYYYNQVGHHKEVLTPEGRLDIYRMIRSALSETTVQNTPSIHPYNFSHQLAVRISECVATLDSIRPQIDHLTKLIWAAQKHLIAKEQIPTHIPFEEFDQLDKLIVRTSLSIVNRQPEISHKALYNAIQEHLSQYQALAPFKSIESLHTPLSCSLASMLFPHLTLHKKLSIQEKEAITAFIQGQLKRCRKMHGRGMKKELQSISSRILSLYPLAAGLPKQLADKQLDAAMKYIYSLSTNVFSPISPNFNKRIFTFINSEIIALKDKKEIGALENVIGTLVGAFKEGEQLPKLNQDEMEELEVWIWATIEKEERLLEKNSSKAQEVLNNELKLCLVEAKGFQFQDVVQQTVHFFHQIRDLPIFLNFFENNATAWKVADQKIERWAVQNAMVCSSLRFDGEHPITRMVARKVKGADNPTEIPTEIQQNVIKENPLLAAAKEEVHLQASLVTQWAYFSHMRCKGETNYDRLIKWHQLRGTQDIQQVINGALPLTPSPSEKKSLSA